MYLLLYSILISVALILAIFLFTYLSDQSVTRKQKLAQFKRDYKLANLDVKLMNGKLDRAPGYLSNLSIEIQKY